MLETPVYSISWVGVGGSYSIGEDLLAAAELDDADPEEDLRRKQTDDDEESNNLANENSN